MIQFLISYYFPIGPSSAFWSNREYIPFLCYGTCSLNI